MLSTRRSSKRFNAPIISIQIIRMFHFWCASYSLLYRYRLQRTRRVACYACIVRCRAVLRTLALRLQRANMAHSNCGRLSSVPPKFLAMISARSASGTSEEFLAKHLYPCVVLTMFPEITSWRNDMQNDCVSNCVLGSNVVAKMPTSYGKSLFVFVPAIG